MVQDNNDEEPVKKDNQDVDNTVEGINPIGSFKNIYVVNGTDNENDNENVSTDRVDRTEAEEKQVVVVLVVDRITDTENTCILQKISV